MQQDLDLMKAENKQLKDIINSKNQTINDFQGLFQASKSKFELCNQTNANLKTRIMELESQLKGESIDEKSGVNFQDKINEYESRMDLSFIKLSISDLNDYSNITDSIESICITIGSLISDLFSLK